jgi:hypothetical protein
MPHLLFAVKRWAHQRSCFVGTCSMYIVVELCGHFPWTKDVQHQYNNMEINQVVSLVSFSWFYHTINPFLWVSSSLWWTTSAGFGSSASEGATMQQVRTWTCAKQNLTLLLQLLPYMGECFLILEQVHRIVYIFWSSLKGKVLLYMKQFIFGNLP